MTQTDLFSLRIDPHDQESLLGVLSRQARRQMLSSARDLLAEGEIVAATPSDLHLKPQNLEPLTRRMGLQSGTLYMRQYRPLNRAGQHVLFNGVAIDRNILDLSARRIAPHTFAATGIHKSIWDLRLMPADPTTGETIIDACPTCKKELKWSHPDMLRCEPCGADLRVNLGARASNQELEVLDFFADILGPDEMTRQIALGRLPTQVFHLGPSRIVDVIIHIGQVNNERIGSHSLKKITPDQWLKILVRGYLVALGWPEAFTRILNELRDGSSGRPGLYSISKNYGSLVEVIRAWDPDLTEFLNQAE